MRGLALLASILCASACDEDGIEGPVRSGAPRVGTFLFSPVGPTGPDQDAFQAARQSFDLHTLPVFLRLVQPTRGTFDFTLPDAVADAAPPGTLLFVPGFSNDLIPDWLSAGSYSADELRDIVVEYVTRVVEHFETKYPDRDIAYEVILEPLSWQGPAGLWHKVGLDTGGDQYEYIRVAFHAAHAAAPDAKLYIDDFGVEHDGEKADAYVELVEGLLADGVPIDGVGFEGHFMIQPGGAFPQPPSSEMIAGNLQRFSALGLETMITSVDIAIRDDDVTPATVVQQLEAYRQLARACTEVASCMAFSTWGIGDTDSWILQFFPGWGAPLLYDAHYAPKPAYDAVRAELD